MTDEIDKNFGKRIYVHMTGGPKNFLDESGYNNYSDAMAAIEAEQKNSPNAKFWLEYMF